MYYVPNRRVAMRDQITPRGRTPVKSDGPTLPGMRICMCIYMYVYIHIYLYVCINVPNRRVVGRDQITPRGRTPVKSDAPTLPGMCICIYMYVYIYHIYMCIYALRTKSASGRARSNNPARTHARKVRRADTSGFMGGRSDWDRSKMVSWTCQQKRKQAQECQKHNISIYIYYIYMCE
jgi:hypothetical protein